MNNNFSHYPVMCRETIDGLCVKQGGLYVDCTAGGGGHSSKILAAGGRLIAIDCDRTAAEHVRERFSSYDKEQLRIVNDNFSNIASILGDEKIDGAIIDLGVSSYQLDTPERGFSYNNCAALDMRMNSEALLTAYEVVNTYSEEELKKLIYAYGEERFAPRIAAEIACERAKKPIETTTELVDIIKRAIPKKAREDGPHPAKRTFQAIRIEVNRELDIIEPTLVALCGALRPGGRLAVITFHSLEDRIVKQTFVSLAKGCICPDSFPVCVCGRTPSTQIITKHPILPGEKELSENPRSRSAKLRILEKL